MEAQATAPHQSDTGQVSYPDVHTILAWHAPGRPFRRKGRQFYLSVLLIVFLIEVILFLFSEYILMVAVAALAFLSVALSSIPPNNFHYRISTEGIKVEDHFYIWAELYDFYFKKIEEKDTLIVTTQVLIPGELKIPLGDMSRDSVRRALLHFLPYREIVRPTFMEKSADWLSRNFPLEKPSGSQM